MKTNIKDIILGSLAIIAVGASLWYNGWLGASISLFDSSQESKIVKTFNVTYINYPQHEITFLVNMSASITNDSLLLIHTNNGDRIRTLRHPYAKSRSGAIMYRGMFSGIAINKDTTAILFLSTSAGPAELSNVRRYALGGESKETNRKNIRTTQNNK